jgi:hypothetical protein
LILSQLLLKHIEKVSFATTVAIAATVATAAVATATTVATASTFMCTIAIVIIIIGTAA